MSYYSTITSPRVPLKVWDFQSNSNFTVGWDIIGSDFTLTSTKIIYDISNDNNDQKVYHDLDSDLGGNASDTAWVFQYTFIITTYSPSPAGQIFVHVLGLIDNLTQRMFSGGATGDRLGVYHDYRGDGSTERVLSLNANNAAQADLDGTQNWNIAGSTQYYGIFKRLTSTTSTLDIFSDAARTISVLSSASNGTFSSAIVNLRYFALGNRGLNEADNGTVIFDYAAFEFEDATSTPPT